MLRSVLLPSKPNRGDLYLCSMPGRFEALDVFLEEMRACDVGHILCLVPDAEIARKSPEYATAIQNGELSGKLLRCGIADYGVPAGVDELAQLLDFLVEKLDLGASVVIHCAAGRGRTGMVAILLLARMGICLTEAIATIRLAGSGPDTLEQWDFIRQRANA